MPENRKTGSEEPAIHGIIKYDQIYHKNYTELGETYQLVLPLCLEGLIPEDDSVRLLSHELEELNYTLLYQAYSAKGRNPAVDPKTMFKILTYAYSQNIYSSGGIETACRRDINFMWLLAAQKAPDHSTIARFRTGFLADACANKYTFVWKKSVGKWEEKMYVKMVMNRTSQYMNVLIVTVALTKTNVPKQKETSGCMYPKTLSA